MRDVSDAGLTPRVVWESGSFHRCSRHAPCGAVNIHSRWLANKEASRVRSESETNGRRVGPRLLCSAEKIKFRSVSPERGERGLQPHGDAALVQVPLGLVDAELVEVEDRGREAGIGIRLGEHLVHVLGIATTG